MLIKKLKAVSRLVDPAIDTRMPLNFINRISERRLDSSKSGYDAVTKYFEHDSEISSFIKWRIF
jgi:hypothetical protein